MSAIATDLLEKIPASKLKDYVGKIVLRTYYSLKLSADEFPKNGRTDDDYDFVQEHVKIITVQGDGYESLSVNPSSYLVIADQKIENYKFFVPTEAGKNSFLEDLRSIKKNAQAEHDAEIKFLDEALIVV